MKTIDSLLLKKAEFLFEIERTKGYLESTQSIYQMQNEIRAIDVLIKNAPQSYLDSETKEVVL
jgi:hypothetical protein